jgi:hypothetical protein
MVQLWEVQSPSEGFQKNIKIIRKIEKVQTTTLGCTQDDDKKHKCSVFGSAAFM